MSRTRLNVAQTSSPTPAEHLRGGEPYVAHELCIPYDQNGDGVIEDVWLWSTIPCAKPMKGQRHGAVRRVGIYAEMIVAQLDSEDPKIQMFAGFVRQGVNRMQQLISDLLSY